MKTTRPNPTHRPSALLLAVVGCLAAAHTALAQPGGGRGPMGFANFDRNADGVITEQEFQQARAERIAERSQQGYRMRNLAAAPPFTDLDLDADGELSPQEFADAQARHRQRMMRPPR